MVQQKVTSKKGQLPDYANRAQEMIRSKGDYVHVSVRVSGKNLIIESEGDPVAKLTQLGGGTFGLSFCTNSGKWEKMPHSGPLEKVIDEMVQTLAPYLVKIPF